MRFAALAPLLVTAVLTTTPAFAQDQPRAVIVGVVRDGSGAPLPGAEVGLETSGDVVLSATFVVSVPMGGGRCIVVKLGLDDKQQGARCPAAR